ncbi:MAG: hypothetical protein V5A46_03260 [Haloferacaceae archaeon]
MAGRYGELNYGRLVKGGVAVGAALFLLGVAGELIGRTMLGGISEFQDTLFVALEFLGPTLALGAVLVFGVAMPLTE